MPKAEGEMLEMELGCSAGASSDQWEGNKPTGPDKGREGP